MAFDLDLNAIQSAAKKRTANPWLMANAANPANLASQTAPNQPESPKSLAGLAELAGLAISHGRLTTRESPAAASSPPPPPLPWLHMDQPWRAADAAYQAHHWQCPACRAAARGRCTERCPEGQRLHDDYTRASTAAWQAR